MSVQNIKKDYSADADDTIPAAIQLAEVSLDDAVGLLMNLERECRLANDFKTLKAVCVAMVRLCYDKKDWSKLNSTLAVISKKRAQSKVAITSIVEEAMTYIKDTPNEDVKVELITTLKDVCAGKMYVEAECARLHLMLAKILESKNDINGACAMIQDVHVETYGTLDRKEKIEFIIEQIRFNMMKKDFIRTLIHSRKMNRKILDGGDKEGEVLAEGRKSMDELKVIYYTLMVEYHLEQKNYAELTDCFVKIFETDAIKTAPNTLMIEAVKSTVLFVLLTKFDTKQQELLRKISKWSVFDVPFVVPKTKTGTSSAEMETEGAAADQEVEYAQNITLLAPYLNILKIFTTVEIIPTQFDGLELLVAHCTKLMSSQSSEKFIGGDAIQEKTADLIETLRVRVIQHNIRVIATYYNTIRMERMCELLSLDRTELEFQLTELCTSGEFC